MEHSNKNIKPTLLDHAILGLISTAPMSGYAIRKVFETTAMGNYSSSPGTIYPALKRLQKLRLVEKKKSEEDDKNKFFITSQGKPIFKAWLTKPLDQNDVARKLDEILLRFGFMDTLLNKQEKVVFLESLCDLLTDYTGQLEAYHKREYDNLPLHGRLAFEHGIESYKTTLKWCEKALIIFTKND
ncbi:MAG: PadR family transcriptional regulator [Bacteroidetes bacterium]|nr:MAG: PadR family transcriptional regulator [Bacteroidota bacterium]